MDAVEFLSEFVDIQSACMALGVNRADFYRRQARRKTPLQEISRPHPPLALTQAERQEALDLLDSERFMDQAPRAVYTALLDEGRYICSVRTMYRILDSEGEVRERRNQRQHPHYVKPELLATEPNQVWSWDITKLKGPAKWTVYYLYVILDIFSRYVVGWMVATMESSELAKRFIAETYQKQGIQPGQLTIHADRGSSMKSKPVAFLLADLGVTKTHSRPYVSDDNPYSESQFKTLKYRPDFPNRFGSIEDARTFCQSFFRWYNTEHYHSGIAMLTPASVHYGDADQTIKERTQTLKSAFDANPLRFKGKLPKPEALPDAAWINKPNDSKEMTSQNQSDKLTELGKTETGNNAGEQPVKG